MLIEGFDVNIQNLGNFVWQINIKNPDGINFVGQVQSPQLNEEIAYHQIWKQNCKQFHVLLESKTEIIKN